MDYTHVKDLISQYTGLEKDALHIHAALFIYILAALLLRRSRRSILPWLVVFGIEFANEVHDLWENWGAPMSWALGESAKDLWNTMLWPSVLLIGGRYTRWFLPREKDAVAAEEPATQSTPDPGTDTGPPAAGANGASAAVADREAIR